MKYKKHFKKAEDYLTLAGDFTKISTDPTVTDDGYSVRGDEIEVVTSFSEHSSGVIKRTDKIKNISDRAVSVLTAQAKFVFDGGEYEVYTQYSEWCSECVGTWQPLSTEVCAANNDTRANTSSVPFFAIYNNQTDRGVVFHIMADSKWSFRVKRHYSQTGHDKKVTVELGITDHGFLYTLGAGEELEMPEILFYEFKNKRDFDAYKLHRYCNELYPAKTFPIIYNSWMSRFDNISYDILSEQLEQAKRIGAEYFVIDAGWFGRPNAWADQVGEWCESTEFSMQGRMAEFADKVRAYGLNFGLWFEIERAAKNSSVVKEHPEHYFCEGGHFFVNFASEKTVDYIFNKVADNVRKYGIRFIKFDHNAQISYDPTNKAFIEYFKGYREFISRLNREFPDLYLQNCASGGLRMALPEMRGFDSFWMSDNHSLYTQLEIFKGALIRMPSRALERWITVRSLENFEPLYGGGVTEKILVSGDAAWGHMEAVNESYLCASILGGPIGISCDLTKLSEKLLAILEREISDYKTHRDFWRSSECRILTDTESLLVLQFSDKEFDRIVLATYLKVPHQNAVTIYPVCTKDATYKLPSREICEKELTEDGITVHLGDRYTSTVTVLEKVGK